LRRYPVFFERARSVLEAVGLADKEARPCGNLSHGEQRQLESAGLGRLAKALLLDEPTRRLSPAESHAMTALLKKLTRDHVAVIEHDMTVALPRSPTASRAAPTAKVVADGSPTGQGDAARAGDLPGTSYARVRDIHTYYGESTCCRCVS